MDIKEFWRQYEIADKDHKKWEKRAEKVVQRYRQETSSGEPKEGPTFNILWANTSVLQPSLFSRVPNPDVTQRYQDEDPIAASGTDILQKGLEFVLDDGDFYSFGKQTVMDYLLPGRATAKIRYVPTYAKVREPVPVEMRETVAAGGESEVFEYYREDERVDPAEVQFDENGNPFIEAEYEEVVDEHIDIERWPWKNFRHQKAKRWKDVQWVDFITYLDRAQLKKLIGRKASQVKFTVDGSGNDDRNDGDFKATHAEVHEVWFARERKVKIAIRENEAKWWREGGDPLRLKKFFPCPPPLLSIDTNDSLRPIPAFTLYQHQANELDSITQRISVLMKALKLAGLYAGSEKDTLRKLFESDENQMIAVEDWHTIKDAGGISGLVEWLPIEQVGKVLSALFRERNAIVQQIFELTGIADIQRGSTDPRETRGAQVIKAQFASRRTLTPKQEVERYFRDVLRIAAEIMSEHFSTDTLQRMTGIDIPEPVRELLQEELQRQYRIDIETDSTVAPDEEQEQANMAKAMEAVTRYVTGISPLVQQGVLAPKPAVQLLRVYLRKFRWGRDLEKTLEAMENAQPQQQQNPEMARAMADMQQKAQEHQMNMQERQMEMQAKQQELGMEMQAKQQEFAMEMRKMMMELQGDAAKRRQELEQEQAEHQQKLQQQREEHDLEMRQDQETHAQELAQSSEVE